MSKQFSLDVNLNAIAENWHALDARVGDAHCGAVLKANGYGLGMAAIAERLVDEGCRELFVANLAEGIALRQSIGGLPRIFVLQGCEVGDEPSFTKHQLVPVLISLAMVEAWLAYSRAEQAACLPCALKVNTGMNRLGVDSAELAQLCNDSPELWLHEMPWLMSHLACADELGHPQNQKQLQRFEQALALVRTVNPAVKASLANSSGVFLGAQYHFDMVRCGAAIYGLNPTPSCDNPMAAVVTLNLPIIQLRKAQGGEAVGYGAVAELAGARVLAVVVGGYADGFFRSGDGVMQGFIRGHRVSLVGRVSMDSMVFDVTEVVGVGGADVIEIMGAHISVDQYAAAVGTIGYEVITRMGERARRCYVGGCA